MEYDIWREGEMTFDTLHVHKIKAALSSDLIAQFEREQWLSSARDVPRVATSVCVSEGSTDIEFYVEGRCF